MLVLRTYKDRGPHVHEPLRQSLLTDRVAVVTGGGAGIGRGIALGLAAFGARVAIWERDPETTASAAEEVGGLGIPTDVRESAEVDEALARTTAELGPVSILVNNAGGVFVSPLLETSENGWDALYRANLKHVILCTQRVARSMVETGTGGSIINVTSIEGVRAAPGYAAYAAAKAGVINFTKTAALELAPHGIRVNALAPDITLTEGMMAVAPAGRREDVRPHRAHGAGRPRRRDGRGRRVPGRFDCPATSRDRPSTSTAGPRPRAGGTTIPRPGPTSWARPESPALGDPPTARPPATPPPRPAVPVTP